jgi:hypothetical protein
MSIMRAGIAGVVCAGLLPACAPFTPPPAVPFAETAEVLPKGNVGVTAAGGGGALGLDGDGVGGAVRVRAGVGGNQEVGLEGTALFVDSGSRKPEDPRWIGHSVAGSVKASWKLGLQPWFAVLGGVGSTFSATGDAVGGDFGMVFSLPRGPVRPYGALRLAMAIPVDHGITDNGGITGGIVVPFGVDFVLHRRAHLLLEGGILSGFGYDDSVSIHFGGYGSLALAVRFGREPATVAPAPSPR